ncbi:NAD-dependent succinate-semialdehyde dehydrogenase [Gulosibacter sp. 10]|uniref:NAD-dependent succinate-semialdehyde dehydrogenase n=1 Tax=Gulosibacter sp. 10 TaxID=1255570 RepID=UPI00097F38A2|nr:NAD-dependent succinate-semialdehyde dehydrogenase [Gulosibacter sp. 10]SJM64106.1 Aldehyde dehydrogenase [Gulosibacter sp. 10]
MTTNLVDGRWFDPERRREVLNPVDGSVVGEIGYGDAELARTAVDAAAAAQAEWGARPARSRSDLLRKAADLISERAETIGATLAREAGKRLPEAIGEVHGSAEYFRWFAEEARRPHGAVYTHEAPNRRHASIRRPAGVVASLTPWNFPCSIQARKLAPALAAGCTVVARVSEKAPLAATEMFRCLTDAGIPAGVVNLVHGPAREITEAYLSHDAVRVVSFTGSTGIGQDVMRLASRNVARPLLELGGNAAFIVFEDADIDNAVEGAMLAKFRNTGQSCIGANRFYVQRSIFDEFTSRLAERISAMTVGDGTAYPVPDLGPCIDDRRVEELETMLAEALDGGGRLLNSPVETPATGSYCAPALVADAPADSALARQEIFGPIAAAFPFDTEAEAFDLANGTDMGLAGYVYTRDADRIWRAAERMEVGVLGVNEPLPTVSFAPMGGVKRSGLGREGAEVGLEEFQETVYLAIGMNS